MNKSELIKHIATASGLTQTQATVAFQAFELCVIETLANGDEVSILGFGTFKVAERSARMGRNPKTGEAVAIAAKKVPVFKAGKALKDAVQ